MTQLYSMGTAFRTGYIECINSYIAITYKYNIAWVLCSIAQGIIWQGDIWHGISACLKESEERLFDKDWPKLAPNAMSADIVPSFLLNLEPVIIEFRPAAERILMILWWIIPEGIGCIKAHQSYHFLNFLWTCHLLRSRISTGFWTPATQ